MGILRRGEKHETPLSASNVGVLVLLFDNEEGLRAQYDEDVAIYDAAGVPAISYEAATVADLAARILCERPAIVHLLARFSREGLLVDQNGAALELYEFMQATEEAGVAVLILASECSMKRFERLSQYMYHARDMDFMIVTERNRHWATFLGGIVEALNDDPRFAVAYSALAVQGPEWLQEGKPLPGTILVGPQVRGRSRWFFSRAQP